MSMYYCLYCEKCKKRLPVFRNGMYCDAEPDDIYDFIIAHQYHGITLVTEHEAYDE